MQSISDIDVLNEQNERLASVCNRVMAVLVVVMFGVICWLSSLDIIFDGDTFSSLNILVAGQNFKEYGFWDLHFLPVLVSGPLSERPDYYLHYPPLPDVMNGVLQSMGVQSIMVMQMVCGMLAMVGVWLLYRVIARVFSPLVALCGMVYLFSTMYFLKFSHTLHCHSYHIFVLGLFIYVVDRYMQRPGKGRGIVCWLVLFLVGWISFEFILFCLAFAWVYLYFTGGLKRHGVFLVILSLAPAVAVGLHFLQNVWAIGWAEACADNLGFSYRGGGMTMARMKAYSRVGPVIEQGAENYLHVSWKLLVVLYMVVLGCYAGQNRGTWSSRGMAFLLAVLVATPLWYLLVPSHAVFHPHTINQFVLMAIIGVGFLLAKMVQVIFSGEVRLIVRCVLALFLLGVGGQSVMLMAKRSMSIPIENKRIQLMRMIGGEALPEDAIVLSDKVQMGFSAYYLQRPAFVVAKHTEIDRTLLDTYASYVKGGHFYFLYCGAGDFLADERFKELAGRCPGKQLQFEWPNSFETGSIHLILFDMEHYFDEGGLDSVIAEKQLGGKFEEWEIEGFNERLNKEPDRPYIRFCQTSRE